MGEDAEDNSKNEECCLQIDEDDVGPSKKRCKGEDDCRAMDKDCDEWSFNFFPEGAKDEVEDSCSAKVAEDEDEEGHYAVAWDEDVECDHGEHEETEEESDDVGEAEIEKGVSEVFDAFVFSQVVDVFGLEIDEGAEDDGDDGEDEFCCECEGAEHWGRHSNHQNARIFLNIYKKWT